MNQTTNFELKLYEGTDLFNPLTVENANFTDIDTAMKGISDAAVSAATELLTGTVHAITRTDSDRDIFVFPATANYAAGETFTVDGTQVTALLPSGTTLPTGAYVIGSNVLCVLNGTLMTVFCDAGADAQTLQGHAASYFATDSDLDDLTTTVGNISTKVGSAVLTTTAPDLSGAVNELNSNLSDMKGISLTLNSVAINNGFTNVDLGALDNRLKVSDYPVLDVSLRDQNSIGIIASATPLNVSGWWHLSVVSNSAGYVAITIRAHK